jgi:hypothetical protein
MSMGNYLNVGPVHSHVMAATETTVAVDHPTVVPSNFDPETCPECESFPCEC